MAPKHKRYHSSPGCGCLGVLGPKRRTSSLGSINNVKLITPCIGKPYLVKQKRDFNDLKKALNKYTTYTRPRRFYKAQLPPRKRSPVKPLKKSIVNKIEELVKGSKKKSKKKSSPRGIKRKFSSINQGY